MAKQNMQNQQESAVQGNDEISLLPEVLVISHLYPRPTDPQAGSFVADGVAALSKAGVSVDVVVPTPCAPLGRFGTHRWRTYASTPSSWRVAHKTVRRVLYFAVPKTQIPIADISTLTASLHRIGRRYSYQPIVVHAHTLFPDGVSAILAFRGRFPIVISIHGADVRPGSGLEWRFRKKIGKWALNQAQVVIANSHRTKNRICEFLEVSPDRVVIIPPGVAVSRFEAILASDTAGTRKKHPEIVAVGNLIPLKGHRELLLALATDKLKKIEWTLTIIGDGPERDNLEKLAFHLRIRSRIAFLGRVQPLQVPRLLKRAQLFALPSCDEAWGVAWAEAQYLGLPAIGCRGQGPEEIIIDNETGYLVKPGDIGELAERMLRLLSNPDLRRRMGEASRVRSKSLDIGKITPRLIEVYKTTLKSHYRIPLHPAENRQKMRSAQNHFFL